MSDLERWRDAEGSLGAAFRSAEDDAPPAGSQAALLAALSLGAVAATATTAAATATATAATTTTTATTGLGAGTATLGKATGLLAAWKVMAVSALIVTGTAASVHLATRAPEPTLAAPTLAATSPAAPAHPVAPAQAGPGATDVVNAVPEAVVTAPLAPLAVEKAPSGSLQPAPLSEAPRANEPARGSASEPVVPSLVAVASASPPTPSAPTANAGATSPEARSAESTPNAGASNPVGPTSPAAEAPLGAAGLGSKPKTARVAEELALLDSARAHLSAGRTGQALAALQDYDKAFANPVLGEEALALKVEALARAGRGAEAAAIGNAFLARRPESSVAGRIRRALAGGR